MNDQKELLLQKLNHKFPFSHEMPFVMSYGSIARSHADSNSKSLLDFIFGVNNTRVFHQLNLQANHRDYSGLVRSGYWMAPDRTLSAIQNIQENYGGKIWYHSHISVDGLQQQIKYGVIHIDHLKSDLLNWDTLYIAGRMHKPVTILKDEKGIQEANQKNLQRAISIALRMLPEKFSEKELFEKIAQLSYMGDIRSGLAEDPGKVKKIVEKDYQGFKSLYDPLLSKMNDCLEVQKHLNSENPLIYLKKDTIPPLNEYPRPYRLIKENLSVRTVSEKDYLERTLASIVKSSSFGQSLKGLLTVPLMTSIKYLYAKVLKRFQ